MMKIQEKFPCPCCGYLTLSASPAGTFEICSVCNWEDDTVQFNNTDFEGGSNEESLKEARLNFCLASLLRERDKRKI